MFVIEVCCTSCTPRRLQMITMLLLEAVYRRRQSFQHGMAVSRALVDRSETIIVLCFYTCACRLPIKALLDGLLFGSAFAPGSLMSGFPLSTMVRALATVLEDDYLAQDCTVTCMSIGRLACYLRLIVVAFSGPNLVGARRCRARGV